MQLAQVAGIHAHWTSAVTAESVEDTGPRIGAVDVSSHQDNVHLTCESPLLKMEKRIVPKEAIALQYHDPATEKATMILPPTMGAPAVAIAQPKWEPLRDLAGQPAGSAPSVETPRKAEISLTAPGVAAAAGSEGRQVFAPRRSLDQRRGEVIADAAVTPQAFVHQARSIMKTYAQTARVDRPSSVRITPQDAEPGVPTTFQPPGGDDSVDV